MTRDTIPPELFKTTSLSPSAGLEPATYRLTAGRSANWATKEYGLARPSAAIIEPINTGLI